MDLTSTLGGLRIANPDEDDDRPNSPPTATTSPAPPPATSSPTLVPHSLHSSHDTVTRSQRPGLLPTLSHQDTPPEGDGLGFDPTNYEIHNGEDQRSRSPLPQQDDDFYRSQPQLYGSPGPDMAMAQPGQQPYQYQTHGPPYRQPSVQQKGPTRPVSSLYQQPNTSTSSTGSYRYREELNSADGNAAGLARTGSRRIIPGQPPSREGSRVYRQSGQQLGAGNGPLPPRRNSKRVRAPTNGSGSGYESPAGSYGAASSQQPPSDDWRERGAAVGAKQEMDSKGQMQTRTIKKGVKDFNFGRTLGEGSYSTVLAATDRQNLKEYAIKVLDKRHIIKEKKVKYVNIERDTLNRLTEHPGIVRLYYTFQDERSLYFVLDLASGGELLGVLKKMGSFDLECASFYSAQILDSIAYMHSRGVIHRDLKPENVLLDRDMHTKITDFGTAKILPDPNPNSAPSTAMAPDMVPGNPTDGSDNNRAVSFVGTAEYVSPELLRDKNACKASDLWAFGCIVYQLLAGRPPFKAANEYLTFQKILSLDYSFPDGFPPVARDLVERLLVLEPAHRLPVEHIKSHRFFDNVQWGKTLWRQKAPRLKPYIPPTPEPIRLNGSQGGPQPTPSHPSSQPPPQRPQLRGVTELPPPSQLDIDWSPVLTHTNERILKLGNMIVHSSPRAPSPNRSAGTSASADTESPPPPPPEKDRPRGGFRSFFAGATTKKRERLVIVTSQARIVIAAAGGNEKKAKMDIDCLGSTQAGTGARWTSWNDAARGVMGWRIDSRDKHLTFEDPRAAADPPGSKFSTRDWLDALETARELALAASSYSLNTLPSSAGAGGSEAPGGADGSGGRPGGALRKMHTDDSLATLGKDGSGGGTTGRKRFSKRHSKSGLAAVF